MGNLQQLWTVVRTIFCRKEMSRIQLFNQFASPSAVPSIQQTFAASLNQQPAPSSQVNPFATPRDGSPTELVALQASALRLLAQLQQERVIEAHVVVCLV
jgi:hypothetical protein